jgi:hypothetical protein
MPDATTSGLRTSLMMGEEYVNICMSWGDKGNGLTVCGWWESATLHQGGVLRHQQRGGTPCCICVHGNHWVAAPSSNIAPPPLHRLCHRITTARRPSSLGSRVLRSHCNPRPGVCGVWGCARPARSSRSPALALRSLQRDGVCVCCCSGPHNASCI